MFKRLIILSICLLFSIQVYANTDIYCPLKKEHLYTYTGDLKKLNESTEKDFILVGTEEILVINDEMVCPFDKSYLNGYLYWFDSRGYSLPRMAYPAVTILTKVDGEFVWLPWELNLEDN